MLKIFDNKIKHCLFCLLLTHHNTLGIILDKPLNIFQSIIQQFLYNSWLSTQMRLTVLWIWQGNKYTLGNPRERGHWGDPDADGRTILRWIFRKLEGVETGWSWLGIGTGGGHLWVRWWIFGFHKMRGISLLSTDPVSFSRRTLLHGVSK